MRTTAFLTSVSERFAGHRVLDWGGLSVHFLPRLWRPRTSPDLASKNLYFSSFSLSYCKFGWSDLATLSDHWYFAWVVSPSQTFLVSLSLDFKQFWTAVWRWAVSWRSQLLRLLFCRYSGRSRSPGFGVVWRVFAAPTNFGRLSEGILICRREFLLPCYPKHRQISLFGRAAAFWVGISSFFEETATHHHSVLFCFCTLWSRVDFASVQTLRNWGRRFSGRAFAVPGRSCPLSG